ncbi:MAG TPA: DUF1203 domain-containing protein [Candidatus Limnocylindrales bacterium]
MRVEAIAPQVLAGLRRSDDAGRETEAYVDKKGGLLLRCCLTRSVAGDRIALVSYAPLRRWAEDAGVDPGAYVELGPIFIHAGECPGPADAYPDALHGGDRVLRAYDPSGRILGGKVVPPGEGPRAAAEWFADPGVALVHVRAVEFGCFMFELRR